MRPSLALGVALCGAFGCLCRYGVGLGLAKLGAPQFPWATLLVNVAGSLAIGVVAAALLGQRIGPEVAAMLATGFLGGFTTFSAFSLETLRLWQDRSLAHALLYVSLSVGLGLAAAAAGAVLGRQAWPS